MIFIGCDRQTRWTNTLQLWVCSLWVQCSCFWCFAVQVAIWNFLWPKYLADNLICHFIYFSAVDWEYFQIGKHHYLLISNAQLDPKTPPESVVYQWRGVEKFVPVHRLPTMPCADWETFEIGGQTYIIYANSEDNLSQIFKAKFRWFKILSFIVGKSVREMS